MRREPSFGFLGAVALLALVLTVACDPGVPRADGESGEPAAERPAPGAEEEAGEGLTESEEALEKAGEELRKSRDPEKAAAQDGKPPAETPR